LTTKEKNLIQGKSETNHCHTALSYHCNRAFKFISTLFCINPSEEVCTYPAFPRGGNGASFTGLDFLAAGFELLSD
jgi:hypothetical protein